MNVDGMLTPVEAGAALLDQVNPDWYTKIDAQTLDIGSCHDCICGQIYGSYWEGARALNIAPQTGSMFGFVGIGGAPVAELRRQWLAQIAARSRPVLVEPIPEPVAEPERVLVAA